MGFFDAMRKLEKNINEAKYGTNAREMTDEDYASWDRALDMQSYRPKTREDVQRALKFRNPVRYRQVMGDIRWVEKQLKKMGLNPEDWRVLL